MQIWDPACERDFKHGCQRGSGGLWNSPAGGEGKEPLVKADRPIGEWNALKIRMQDDRVSVVLNEQLVVDNQPMPNSFTKHITPLPNRGPIQIQTHDTPMHVRNVFIRELGTARCTGQPIGVIRTKRPVTNLELSAEWRHRTAGGNSGIVL